LSAWAEVVELAAGDFAHLDEVRARAREGLGVHHRLAEELQVSVLQVEIHAPRRRHPVLRRLRVFAGRSHRCFLSMISAYLNSRRHCQPIGIAFAVGDD